MKVFVSYNHQQAAWVRDDLVSCLDAGGWPFFVQLAADNAVSLLNKSKQRQIEEALLEAALDKAIVSGSNVFHELLYR